MLIIFKADNNNKNINTFIANKIIPHAQLIKRFNTSRIFKNKCNSR